MNLLLLEPGEADGRGVVRLEGPRARHLLDVLRAAPGREIRLGVVDGPLGTGRVLRADAAKREVELEIRLGAETPPRPRIDLLLALPRPKVLGRLWAVLASLGVGHVWLTNAWRVEKCYFDTHVLAPETIRAGLLEGLVQARDTRLPVVTLHRHLRALVEDELPREPYAARILAEPDGAGRGFSAIGRGLPPDGRVLVAIGPEGGWIQPELDLLEARGFERAGWGGGRPLRTDVACSVLLGALADGMAAGH
jgi:RsmE family RNA methyltransferase